MSMCAEKSYRFVEEHLVPAGGTCESRLRNPSPWRTSSAAPETRALNPAPPSSIWRPSNRCLHHWCWARQRVLHLCLMVCIAVQEWSLRIYSSSKRKAFCEAFRGWQSQSISPDRSLPHAWKTC